MSRSTSYSPRSVAVTGGARDALLAAIDGEWFHLQVELYPVVTGKEEPRG